jgi:hypothetical protein
MATQKLGIDWPVTATRRMRHPSPSPAQGGENTQGDVQQAAGNDRQGGKDQGELQMLQHERQQWLLKAK